MLYIILTWHRIVFETELVGIEGVAPPQNEPDKEEQANSAAEKVASVVSEVTEAAKTLMADTDDVQGHEEL